MVGDGETFLAWSGWEGFCVCEDRLFHIVKKNLIKTV